MKSRGHQYWQRRKRKHQKLWARCWRRRECGYDQFQALQYHKQWAVAVLSVVRTSPVTVRSQLSVGVEWMYSNWQQSKGKRGAEVDKTSTFLSKGKKKYIYNKRWTEENRRGVILKDWGPWEILKREVGRRTSPKHEEARPFPTYQQE